MGGPAKEKLDLLEQKIKFTLRPLINTINTSGINRERRIELNNLLLEISDFQQSIENLLKQSESTESNIRLKGLVDYLYALIKGAGIKVDLPDRREHQRQEVQFTEHPVDEIPKTKGIRILSLSMGGMRLHTLAKLKVGSVFHTKLNSSRHGTIPLRGEVVWSRPKDKGEGYIVGIHFSPMDKEVLKALRVFLEESGTDNVSL